MSAVSGTRRTMKELVDGTIRVQIDIDPKFRQSFLELFPSIDMPIALAPLIPGFEQASTGAEDKKPSGWKELGPLCQSSIDLGKTEAFQQWVLSQVCVRPRGKEVSVEVAAADYIRTFCKVGSRKDLDTDADAKTRFGAMMADYRKWLDAAH